MKKILIILAVLVALVVLGVGAIIGLAVYGLSNIDTLAKRFVEQGGTYATGVPTTVGGVDVGLADGTLEMTGLTIANPPGYESAHFFAMDAARTGVDYATIGSPVIRVPEITLSGLDVNLDQTGDRANYEVILDNLKRFETGGNEQPEPAPSGKSQKLVVDSLRIENIEVRLIGAPGLSLVAGDVAVSVPLIEMTDVGGEDGMSFGELTNLVVKTVLTAVVDAGEGAIPGEILGQLTGGLGELSSLGEMGVNIVGGLGEGVIKGVGEVGEGAAQAVEGVVEGAGEAVGGVVEGAGETVKDAVGGLGEGLGNLLGGDKDEDDEGGP